MKSIEVTGKTVEEALKNALNELKLQKDKVEVEILMKVVKVYLIL